MNMCTLLNEGEYCSCGIFLENYLKEISWDRIQETAVKKSMRIFILLSNEGKF